jgi:hypothetical protein
MFGEQKVNGVAIFVDRAIEIPPLAIHFNVGLIHAPTDVDRPLAPVKGFLQLRAVFDHPPADCRVIHVDPTLEHEFFDVARAQRIRHIPADPHQNDLWGEMRPFEIDRHRLAPS